MKIKKLLLAFLMLVGLCISISAKTVTTNASLSDNKIFKINGEEKISYLVGGVELHEQKIGALKDCAMTMIHSIYKLKQTVKTLK